MIAAILIFFWPTISSWKQKLSAKKAA